MKISRVEFNLKEMGYDDVIPYLGEFGRYQKRIYFLLCLPAISVAFQKLASVFLLAQPDFRCQLPFEDTNSTYNGLTDEIRHMSYPIDEFTKTWSTCQYLSSNFSENYFQSGIRATEKITCNRYIYDDSKYHSSAVTEWDLVCGRTWMVATANSFLMVGGLLGSLIVGQMSDKLGRKPVFLATLVLQLIFGTLVGVAPEYITFTISRILTGATADGGFLVAYVIAMEMVGPKHRLLAGIGILMFFSLGYMLVAAFAYFITDWRFLQIALTLPVIGFTSYYWFIPESPRWLLSKRRKDDAIMVIKRAAKINKVQIPQDVYNNLMETDVAMEIDHEPSIIDLFRYSNLRKKSLLIFFDWFVIFGTYYALSWNTSNLGGSDLLNFLIAGAVEIPAYIFLLCTLNRWGRQNILCGSMLTAGTLLLSTMFVPEGQDLLVVTLAMLGKMAITSSLGTVFIFSNEHFPTPVRNVGLGTSSMAGRSGAILAPYINLLAFTWKPLPLIVVGIATIIAGFLTLFLPETLNKKLPETIEEGESFGKKSCKIDVEADVEELKMLNFDKANAKDRWFKLNKHRTETCK